MSDSIIIIGKERERKINKKMFARSIGRVVRLSSSRMRRGFVTSSSLNRVGVDVSEESREERS